MSIPSGLGGATIIAYKRIREDWLRRLRLLGIDAYRFVSHDQTTFLVNGFFKETPWMEIARRLCLENDADAIFTLNEKALPKLQFGDTEGAYTPETFAAWVQHYAEYMSATLSTFAIDYGNEPDASSSLFRNNEAEFRRRYQIMAEAAPAVPDLQARLIIGGGGFCQDWARARDFVAWAETEGVRLDFVSLHVYGTASKLATAVNAVREVSDVPIWLIESGADWRPNLAAYADVAAQRAWLADFAAAVDDLGVSRWNMHGAWMDPTEAWASPYNCLMDAGGRLTGMCR